MKIISKRQDDIKQGKCCSNIQYTKFTPKILKSPTKAPLFTKTKIKKPRLEFKNANHCLEIFSPNIARWRICGISPMDIYRLHLKLIFAIIKDKNNLKDNKQTKKVIERFLSNSMLVTEPVPFNWNWMTQTKWPGKCQSRFMQSPQMIEESKAIVSQQPEFSISFNLLNTHVEIVRRYAELIIKFKNDPGLFRIKFTDKVVTYQPKYISFRFPGDHNILGKRFDGEILIHCEEFVRDDKSKMTNGLIVSFPLEANPQYTNYDLLENLSVDFWRFMVLKKGKYTPKDYLSMSLLT